ncbi:hypothetical protein Tco_1126678, partial [Tanacetum coccineum]
LGHPTEPSDSSSSSVSGEGVNTADFPVNNSRNDADSSEDIFTAQNEEVATLDENVFSEGDLDQNQLLLLRKWMLYLEMTLGILWICLKIERL